MNQYFTKDPSAVLDYEEDWSAWLDTDTIHTSTWTVPTGLTNSLDTFSDTICTIWLSGGTLNASYTIVNHIVTHGGRTDERSFYLSIKNK